jgi:hypothetical protein
MQARRVENGPGLRECRRAVVVARCPQVRPRLPGHGDGPSVAVADAQGRACPPAGSATSRSSYSMITCESYSVRPSTTAIGTFQIGDRSRSTA